MIQPLQEFHFFLKNWSHLLNLFLKFPDLQWLTNLHSQQNRISRRKYFHLKNLPAQPISILSCNVGLVRHKESWLMALFSGFSLLKIWDVTWALLETGARYFIKGYCELGECSSICCLGLLDGPGQFFYISTWNKYSFNKQCLPYMVSMQKIFFGKKNMSVNLQFWTSLLFYKLRLTQK